MLPYFDKKDDIYSLSFFRRTTQRKDQLLDSVDTTIKLEYVAADKPQPFFHKLFEQRVLEFDTHIAIHFGDKQITYGELNQCSNQLARYLQSKLSFKDTPRVALVIEKSLDFFISILAIMKTGAAFVLVELPKDGNGFERMQIMLNESKPELILTTNIYASQLTQISGLPTIYNINDKLMAVELAKENKDNLNLNFSVDTLAYIVFTSGSSGKPKGPKIPHKGLFSRLVAHHKVMNISDKDVIAQGCPLNIDACLMEMMMALGTGARLELIPLGLDISQLTEYLNDNGITIAILVPSLLEMIDPFRLTSNLRVILSTGEKLTLDLIKRFEKGRRFINGYGPSEFTIGVSLWRYPQGTSVSIGKPIDGVDFEIRAYNADLKRVGDKIIFPETEGVLCLKGLGIFYGYCNENDNHGRFIEIEGNSYFITGDIVRLSEEHNVEFVGRYDKQLKKYGRLIATEEIEENIKSCEIEINNQRFKPSHVQINKHDKTSCLVAEISFQNINVESVTQNKVAYQIINQLQFKLPDYMLPTRFIFTNTDPQNWKSARINFNDNDKFAIAKKANDCITNVIYDEITATCLTIWKDILFFNEKYLAEQLSIDDNFVFLGGDSLKYKLMVAKILDRYPDVIFPTDQFERMPTIANLARYIQNYHKMIKPTPLNIKAKKFSEEPEQQPLFLIHALLGDGKMDYKDLADQFFEPVFCFSAITEENEEPFLGHSIEDYARQYYKGIRSLQRKGPYNILGWSAGGVIGHAISELFRREGEKVCLIIIDSTSSYYLNHQMADVDHLNYAKTLYRLTARLIGVDPKLSAFTNFELEQLNMASSKSQQIELVFSFLKQRSIREEYVRHVDIAKAIALCILSYKQNILTADDSIIYAKKDKEIELPGINQHLGWNTDACVVKPKIIDSTHLGIMTLKKPGKLTELVENLREVLLFINARFRLPIIQDINRRHLLFEQYKPIEYILTDADTNAITVENLFFNIIHGIHKKAFIKYRVDTSIEAITSSFKANAIHAVMMDIVEFVDLAAWYKNHSGEILTLEKLIENHFLNIAPYLTLGNNLSQLKYIKSRILLVLENFNPYTESFSKEFCQSIMNILNDSELNIILFSHEIIVPFESISIYNVRGFTDRGLYDFIIQDLKNHDLSNKIIIVLNTNTFLRENLKSAPKLQKALSAISAIPRTNINEKNIELQLTRKISDDSNNDKIIHILPDGELDFDIETHFVNLALVDISSINNRKMTKGTTTDTTSMLVSDENAIIKINDFAKRHLMTYENEFEIQENKYVSLETMFGLETKRGHFPRVILITGPAGIGKTTLCQYISWKWSNNLLWNVQFEWLFHIKISDLLNFIRDKKELTIENVILELSVNNKNFLTKERIPQIQSSDQKCIIIDGLDEFSFSIKPEYDTCLKFIKGIIRNKNFSVILTSRPYAIADIFDARLYESIDIHLEILGLNNKNIPVFIDNFSKIKKCNDDFTPSLKTFLSENISVWNICHTPLLFAFVCKIWSNNKYNNLKGSTELNYTSIHIKILNYLAQLHLSKHVYQDLSKREGRQTSAQLPQDLNFEHPDIKNIFAFYAKLSFVAMNSQSIVIPPELMQATLNLMPTRENKYSYYENLIEKFNLLNPLVTGKSLFESPCQMIHLSFQEFFAAYYFTEVMKNDNQTQAELIPFCNKNKYNPRFEHVFAFIAGLVKDDLLLFNRYMELLKSSAHDVIGSADMRLYLRIHNESQCKYLTSEETERFTEFLTLDIRYLSRNKYRRIVEYLQQAPFVIKHLNWFEHIFSLTQSTTSEFNAIITKLLADLFRDDIHISTILLKKMTDLEIWQQKIIIEMLGYFSNYDELLVNTLQNCLKSSPELKEVVCTTLFKNGWLNEVIINLLLDALKGADVTILFGKIRQFILPNFTINGLNLNQKLSDLEVEKNSSKFYKIIIDLLTYLTSNSDEMKIIFRSLILASDIETKISIYQYLLRVNPSDEDIDSCVSLIENLSVNLAKPLIELCFQKNIYPQRLICSIQTKIKENNNADLLLLLELFKKYKAFAFRNDIINLTNHIIGFVKRKALIAAFKLDCPFDEIFQIFADEASEIFESNETLRSLVSVISLDQFIDYKRFQSILEIIPWDNLITLRPDLLNDKNIRDNFQKSIHQNQLLLKLQHIIEKSNPEPYKNIDLTLNRTQYFDINVLFEMALTLYKFGEQYYVLFEKCLERKTYSILQNFINLLSKKSIYDDNLFKILYAVINTESCSFSLLKSIISYLTEFPKPPVEIYKKAMQLKRQFESNGLIISLSEPKPIDLQIPLDQQLIALVEGGLKPAEFMRRALPLERNMLVYIEGNYINLTINDNLYRFNVKVFRKEFFFQTDLYRNLIRYVSLWGGAAYFKDLFSLHPEILTMEMENGNLAAHYLAYYYRKESIDKLLNLLPSLVESLSDGILTLDDNGYTLLYYLWLRFFLSFKQEDVEKKLSDVTRSLLKVKDKEPILHFTKLLAEANAKIINSSDICFTIKDAKKKNEEFSVLSKIFENPLNATMKRVLQVPLLTYQANFALHRGEITQAEIIISDVTRLTDKINPRSSLFLLSIYQNKSDYTAVKDLAKILISNGLCTMDAYQYLILCAFSTGDIEEILLYCETILKADPDSYFALSFQAYAYVLSDNAKLATTTLKTAEEKFSNRTFMEDSGFMENFNGIIAHEKGELENALMHFSNAIKLECKGKRNGACAFLYYNRCLLYFELNEPEKAKNDLNSAAELFSFDYIRAILAKGLLEGVTGNAETAKNYFNKAIALAPNNSDCYFYYAKFLIQQKKLQDAREILTKAQSINPNSKILKRLMKDCTELISQKSQALYDNYNITPNVVSYHYQKH